MRGLLDAVKESLQEERSLLHVGGGSLDRLYSCDSPQVTLRLTVVGGTD